MALPLMQAPVYELTIPSTKKKVKFRPFLVKEQKALLIAQQSDDPKVMIETVKYLIQSCVKGIDLSKLALFDIEYIFLQLRAKSIGEISELIYSCLKCKDPKAKVKLEIDISKIEVEFPENVMANIELYDDVGVKMKYPDFDFLEKSKNLKIDDIEDSIEIITNCIEFVYDGDKIYGAKEQSKEELKEFVENLTNAQYLKIKNFFENIPRLKKEVNFSCPVCNYNHNYTIEGIKNFF